METMINVRIETGFLQRSEAEVQTQTQLFTIQFDDHQILDIKQQDEPIIAQADELDAQGYLLAPPLKDYHIHLDKGHYGGPWQAVIPMHSVAERIEEERGFLKDFLPLLPDRADQLLKLIQSYGCDYFRTQVNIDPVIGLEHFFIVRDVLAAHQDELDFDLVAFPQHGFKRTEALGYLSQALEAGCQRIGGVDPATLDQDIEGVLTQTFDLAKHYNVPIDIHLHDPGTLGLYEIKRIMDYTETYQMAGHVAISHAYALGDLEPKAVPDYAKRLSELDIAIHTTMPIDMAGSFRRAMPWVDLLKESVTVRVINDNIHDHWSCFGSGDLLERVSRAAEIYGQVDECALNRAYQLVSGGIRTLSDDGKQLWPKVGDEPSFLLLNCSCIAEAVARIPKKRRLFHKGKEVTLDDHR